MTHIEVEVTRPRDSTLVLSYLVSGTITDIRMSPVATAARSDELWRHTCFEAFVRALPGIAYYEFNFAPSTQWAAYRFSSYRSERCLATEIKAPSIEVQSSPDSCLLQATLDLNCFSDLPREASWGLGLSALIEEIDGRKSHWALSHPTGRPDFHHPDCFVLEISPAGQQ